MISELWYKNQECEFEVQRAEQGKYFSLWSVKKGRGSQLRDDGGHYRLLREDMIMGVRAMGCTQDKLCQVEGQARA